MEDMDTIGPAGVPVEDDDDELESTGSSAGGTNGGAGYEDDDDGLITEEDLESMVSRVKLVPGDFILTLTEYKFIEPAEKRGGDEVTFMVAKSPMGPKVIVPKGGWPTVAILFPKYLKPTEGQMKNQIYARADMASLAKAVAQTTGGYVKVGGGKIDLRATLMKGKGHNVQVTVAHVNKGGRINENFNNWRKVGQK